MGKPDDPVTFDAPVPSVRGTRVRISSPGAPPVVYLALPRMVIGRDAASDIRIDDPFVSREHAILHFGNTIELEDLGARNGVLVGGARVTGGARVLVAPGTAVQIGQTTLVAYVGEPEEERAPISLRDPNEAPMDRAARVLAAVAPTDVSVILCGETGVGKDVHAERIHAISHRKDGPFVAINCAAIAANLIESELFGYEKGAFTGALAAKIGLLEAGNKGTVFLDEVAELPMILQAKLLRALEKREVVPVGATRARPFDVRFVSATHRDLEEWVSDGRFRADLYYRLHGMTIDIPPLRERTAEIAPLSLQFISEISARLGRHAPALSEEALAKLQKFSWPGNVRELKNAVERAVVLSSSGVLRADHFDLREPVQMQDADDRDEPIALDDALSALERRKIEAALEQAGGNQTKAAQILGVTRKSLLYRMAQWKKLDEPSD